MTVAHTFEKCRPISELKVTPFRVNLILSALQSLQTVHGVL